LKNIFLYTQSSNLECDEIFLLLTELEEKGFPIRAYPISKIHNESLQDVFRRTLDPDFYRSHFREMGKHSKFRSSIALLRGFRPSGFGLGVLTFLLMAVAEPMRAYGMLVRLFCWVVLQFNRARHNLARSLVWTFYFFRTRLLRLQHPIWFLKTFLPPVYWIAVFPVQKLWWFGRYQIESKVLARREVQR
jgi:hypothetical protein